jgi:hypothetical protein
MTMRLGFVVQRYGLEIAGGAEYHCRLIAERLRRHAQVEVLTTCARDYITWANHYPEGEEVLNGVRVRRYPVEATRDDWRYSAATASVLGRVACVEPGQVDPAVLKLATEEASLGWLHEQGPRSPGLVAALEDHARALGCGRSGHRWWPADGSLRPSSRCEYLSRQQCVGRLFVGAACRSAAGFPEGQWKGCCRHPTMFQETCHDLPMGKIISTS